MAWNWKTGAFALVAAALILLLGGVFGYRLGAEESKERSARPPQQRAQSGSLPSGDVASADSGDMADSKPVTFVPGRDDSAEEKDFSAPGARIDRANEQEIVAAFRRAALLDPQAAIAKVRQLPDDKSREIALLTLLGEWSGMTSADMLRNENVRRLGAAGALAVYLMESGKFTPQQAAGMAGEFLSGSELRRVLGRSAARLAPSDPAAALALGNSLDGWQQSRFLESFAAGWASADPVAARTWAAQLGDERTRNAVLARILRAEAESNPALAAQNFSLAAFPDAGERMRVARQIASSWAGRDTLAAIQWADALTDEAARAAAKQGISSTAPVGIGAVLNTSQDGRPVLQQVVPGAPASAALKAGDTIMSVQGADGVWVDSKSVPLWELTSLIRGQAGSSVSLQVQSPGDSAPRAITLQRQQIIHRPQQ
ncbi:MAG: hypothetical protein FGM15_09805 [Chthoniobacterales bacterium]|nr:hypothetical protein [Chthoniobacterales bacterium]